MNSLNASGTRYCARARPPSVQRKIQIQQATSAIWSVDADHHIRGLDHRVGVLSRGQLQFIDGRIGDGRRHDDSAADFNFDVRGRCTLGHVDDLALEAIACTDLHVIAPILMLRSSEAWPPARRSNQPGRRACRTAAWSPGGSPEIAWGRGSK